MKLRETLATNLRLLRHQQGLTQEDLADRSGISARYVGSLERARVAASIDVIERLATALKISPLELLGPADPRS